MAKYQHCVVVVPAAFLLGGCAGRAIDPLPSWADTPTRAAIVDFVDRVTTRGPDYVPPEMRIAVFDNDGTLWAESPMYSQVLFAMDRVREMSPRHPEWASDPAMQAAAAGDLHALGATGQEGVVRVLAATHAGMTTQDFSDAVEAWVASARHPALDRPYTTAVYQPMLELLAYLRDEGFSTWIVSGGEIDFMRAWAEEVYGIPPHQVIGTTFRTRYDATAGAPVISRLPEIAFNDDGPGKPLAIHNVIGRRPILAVGNSDGDFEMIEWVTAGPGPRLGAIVHHDDAEREFAYDRGSHVGRLERGLDAAPQRGWLLISMREDWSTAFPEP